MIVDAHVHLYEFSEDAIKKYKGYILLTVAEDISSSIKNLKLSFLYENVIPSVGIHPWNIEKSSFEDLKRIEEIINKSNIKVLGEIGLDRKFVPNTYEKQLKFFEKFLELAKEYNLSLNLHCPDAWKDVFDLLLKYDIRKAYFHWYTGPLDLLDEIQSQGYFIGINPAAKIQKKHLEVLKNVNLKNLLTESDGPYRYRNLYLMPELIEESLKLISEIKQIDVEKLKVKIQENLSRYLA